MLKKFNKLGPSPYELYLVLLILDSRRRLRSAGRDLMARNELALPRGGRRTTSVTRTCEFSKLYVYSTPCETYCGLTRVVSKVSQEKNYLFSFFSIFSPFKHMCSYVFCILKLEIDKFAALRHGAGVFELGV